MGWTPAEVDACSLWEFLAARAGWLEANSAPEDRPAPSADEHDAMVEKWG
jgi:hypothetical protein